MKETLGFPTCYLIDSNLQIIDIKRGAALVPLKTPNKKAYEMNYAVFKERITQLITI
jgi:hypothetical protein